MLEKTNIETGATDTPLAKLPASGTAFEEFIKFAVTPTTHDGKDIDTTNTDFDDIDPETGLKTTPKAASGTNTQPPANNAANGSNLNAAQQPTVNQMTPAVRSDAKAMVKGFDFLHGILLNFIAELTPQEEADRKFRAKDKELNEMSEMLSQIMIEDNMERINPKWILMLMFMSVYVERSLAAVRDKKAKVTRRREARELKENFFADDTTALMTDLPKTKSKTVQPTGKRSNGLLGKKRGSYNKSK